MPTKTPATMIRLSCSHFSNWPTQPFVWMEPCCSSSCGHTGVGSVPAPTGLISPPPPPHPRPGPQASAPAAWSSATGLGVAGSSHHWGLSTDTPSSDCPAPFQSPYCIVIQALSWNCHITVHISGSVSFPAPPPLQRELPERRTPSGLGASVPCPGQNSAPVGAQIGMSKCAYAHAHRSTAPLFGSTKAWMVLRTQHPSPQIPEALHRSLRVPLPIPVPPAQSQPISPV